MTERMEDQITAPFAKAVTALTAGGGSAGVASVRGHIQDFLPVDLIGWLSAAAAAAGLFYTLCLLTEWWWKKVWKPLLYRSGWIKSPHGHIDSTFTVD